MCPGNTPLPDPPPQAVTSSGVAVVGWNFLFVGATTLLTQTYRPAERARTQAANDLLVFAAVAASSFSSGPLLSGVAGVSPPS